MMMKELQLWQGAAFDNQNPKQQTLSQRGGQRAEYLSLSTMIVCWVQDPDFPGVLTFFRNVLYSLETAVVYSIRGWLDF